MPRKNALLPVSIISSGSMGANVTSSTVNIQFLDNVAIHAIYTGTAEVGTLQVEGSNLGSTWNVIVTAAVNGDNDVMFSLNQMSFPLIRLRYIRTSGTGTLNATLSAKEI